MISHQFLLNILCQHERSLGIEKCFILILEMMSLQWVWEFKMFYFDSRNDELVMGYCEISRPVSINCFSIYYNLLSTHIFLTIMKM